MTSERTWAVAVGQANAYRDLLVVANKLMDAAAATWVADGGSYAETLIHEIGRLQQMVTEMDETIAGWELDLAIQQVDRGYDSGRRS